MSRRVSPPLPYFEVHQGDGPHLLMVHGMLSSRAQWLPNLAALRQVATPVVVELFGHGRSPSPRESQAYRPTAYVTAFETIRKRLGVERWLLLGQSLGAALTLRYALDLPQHCQAHIMTNSNSAFADQAWTDRVRDDMRRFEAAVARLGMAAVERMPVHPARSRNLEPEIKAALVADAALHDPRGIALTGAQTATHSNLERLQDNRVTTLLLCGTRERRFAPARARAQARMKSLSVIELEAGHAVNLEAPHAFNQACIRFIKETSS